MVKILKPIFKFSAILTFICAVGLGPALAQNIFLSPNRDAQKPASSNNEDEGRRIFLSPKKASSAEDDERVPVVSYKDRLVVRAMRKVARDKIKTLEDWESQGLQPQSIEERMMYASAKRAVSQNAMYERRQKLMADLEKRQVQIEARLARKTRSAIGIGGDAGDTRVESVVDTEQPEGLEELEALQAVSDAPAMSAAQLEQLKALEEQEKNQSRVVKNAGSSWFNVFRKKDNNAASDQPKKSGVFTKF